METSTIIRFTFIALLWLILCYLVIVGRPLNLYTIFIIVTSGIIVWVPLYKKYIKNGRKQK